MTGSRSVTKPVAVLVSVMMLAGLLVMGPASVASAQPTVIPDEIGREDRPVSTDLRCLADGGTLGALDIPFSVPITSNSPTSVQPGKNFIVDIKADEVPVPSTFEGLPVTINNFTNLRLRASIAEGVEVISVSSVANSGFFQANGISNPNAPKTFINPTPQQLFWNADTREVRLELPGPYTGNSIVKPPTIRAVVKGNTSGTVATSQLAGRIPSAVSTFPWPEFAFSVRVAASVAGVTTITADAFCSPNYGRGANVPGNDKLPVPFLSRTNIDGDGPALNVRTPRNGFTYDVYDPVRNPDSKQLIADFDCTDPSGVVSCVMTDRNGNVVNDGDRLPDTSNNSGQLTIRATDNFGFTSEEVIEYEVSSNSAPVVDAGVDIEAATNKRVELQGSATDVDFGQLISYRWIQIGGPAVELEDTSDPFDTTAAFRTPSGPETLVFALRADDGQAYAEDTVTITVDRNNAPQVTNGQFQRLGYEDPDLNGNPTPPIPTRSTVTMDVTSTDADDQPVSYRWRQVDEFGVELPAESPDRVTLSSTTAPVVTFQAPNQSREFRLYFEAVVSDGDPRSEVVAEVAVKIRRNLEPVFGGTGNTQLIENIANGAPVRMIASAIDPEGRPVTYAWKQVDENGVELSPSDPRRVTLSNTDSTTVDFDTAVTAEAYKLYFQVVASDGLELGDSTANIEVRVRGNEPPLFTNGPTQDIDVQNRGSVTIDASATDPEARELTYAWRQVDAEGNDLAGDSPDLLTLPSTTSPTVELDGPDSSDEKTYYFRVTAADGVSNGTVEAAISVTFGPNLPPTVAGGLNQTISDIENRGDVELDATATDPEGRSVTYAWRQVDADGEDIAADDPLKVTLSATDTAKVTFSGPDTSLASTLYFRAVVSDGLDGGDAEASYTVQIRGNNPPVITADAEQFGISGKTITLDGSASDIDITNGDDQTLSWAWVQTDANGDPLDAGDPLKVALSSASATSPTYVSPISNTVVTRYFVVTVTDGFDPVSLLISSTLSANNAPTADAGADQTVKRGGSVTLSGSGTDPDGHSIGAYLWNQTGGPTVTLSSNDIAAPTFTAPNNGPEDVELTFELLVYDEFGQVSASPDTVVITVRNQAPTANAGADQSGRGANTTVTISGTATDPDIPPSVTTLWQQVDVNGDLVTDPETDDLTDTFLEIADPTALTTTFVTPQTSSSRTYYLRLTATDDGGLTATDTVAIQVNPVSLGTPTADPGTSAVAGTYIQLTMPQPGAPSNTSENFTYEWYQTNATSSTTPCAPSCTGATAVIHTSGTYGSFTATERQPVVEMPGRANRNPATSFFRAKVTDTFGGADLNSSAVTLTTTNSSPTVEWSIRGYGSTSTNQLWTGSTPNNPVWSAAAANSDNNGTILLDATQNPAVDAFTEDLDQDTLTYEWSQWNNAYSWVENYNVKTAAVTVVTTNYAIPGGNRNCSNIDLGGVSNLANGARVLLVGQTNAAQNGVWIVPNRSSTFIGICRNNGGQWARATDLDAANELGFAKVSVTSGTGANKAYVLNQYAANITVNTTALNFTELSPTSTTGLTTNEPIYKELAGTGRNTDAKLLRTTAAGTGVNSVSNNTGLAYLSVPANTQVPLKLTVTDGVAATQTFSMVVRTSQTANTAPAATRTSSATQTIRGGVSTTLDPVTLGATIDDAEARTSSTWPVNGSSVNENLGPQSLSYQWIQTDASGNELASDSADRVTIANDDLTAVGQVAAATAVDTTFAPPSETKTLYFRLRLTDGIKTSLSAVQTVVFQINRIAPVADAGDDQDDVEAGSTVTLDGTGSTDEDGTISTYLWEQVDVNGDAVTSGPTKVTLSSDSASQPTFSAPSLDGPADLYFRLTATDDFGDSDTDTVRIGVLDDAAPTATAGFSPDPVVLGQTATLSGEGSSDPEGQTLSYSWVQEDGSGNALASSDADYVTLTNATSRDATFTVPAREFSTTLYFRLTVSDGAASPQTDSALVTIAVDANLPPSAAASASTAVAGGTVTLSSEGTTDPENDDLTYLWEEVDEAGDPVVGGVTLTGATTDTATFTAPGLATPSTIRVRLTVTDEYGASDTSDVVVIEVPANQAPVVDASASPNPADPGDTVTLSAGATDPEGVSPLTYSWTQTGEAGAPLGGDDRVVTLSSTTAESPTFTVQGELAAYTLHFRVAVTDEFGVETTDDVTVNVNANRAPTVTTSATPDPSPAGATVTITADGTDPDGDTVTYAWVQVDSNGDPVTGEDLVTLSATNTASATFQAPDRLTETVLYFRVTVADPYGATGTSTVTVTTTPNTLPTISASASPTEPAAGETVTLTGTATDPEGRTMTYQWTQVDDDSDGDVVTDGVTIDDATTLEATFEAPGYETDTELYFRLSVTDDTGVPVTTTVTVTVQANEAPEAVIAGAATVAPPGATVELDGTESTDPEGDPIAGYAWSQVSGALVTIADPTAATTSFIAPSTNGGLVGIELVVTDRWGKQSTAASLLVALAPNNNPFANAGAAQNGVIPGETVTLDGSASMDADSHDITYAWSQLSGPTVTLSDATAEKPTFVPVTRGDYLFQLVVTDEFDGVSNPAFVLVKVNANRNPVVNAGADQSDVAAATVVTLSATVSDPDVEAGAAQTVTSVWTQTAGPAMDLEGSDPLTKTFRAPSSTSDQTLTFQLSADDGIYGGTASDTVSIVVKANRVPVVDAGDDQNDVAAATVVTLDGSATDADIEAGANQSISYTWSQVSGEAVTLEGASDTTKTFRVPSTNADQTLVFRLAAADGTGEGADEVSIFVKANRLPEVNAGNDQTDIVPGTTVTLSGSASDADIEAGADQTLTVEWLQVDLVNLELIDPAQSLIAAGSTSDEVQFVAPSSTTDQEYAFAFVASDGVGEDSVDIVRVFVKANRAPTVDAGSDQSDIVAATEVTLSGSATDADITAGSNQTITGYTWSQVSGDTVSLEGASATTKTFRAPSTGDDQTLVFRLVATDGTTEGSDEVSIFVKANRPPVVNAGEDQFDVEANDPVTVIGSVTDEDPQTVSVEWTQVAGDAVSGLSGTTSNSISFRTPIAAADQTLRFRLTATDGTATVFDEVEVGVKANRAPIASAGQSLTGVAAASTVNLDGRNSTDPEAQPLTYSWAQTAGSPVTITNPTSAQASFTAPQTAVGTSIRMTLTVTDSLGLTATSNVSITVVANRPPVANAGADQVVPRQRLVTLDGSASADPDAQVITYNWVQVDGLNSTNIVSADDALFAVLSDETAAQPTFTSPRPVNDGDMIYFMLVVRDPSGLQSPPSWTKVTLNKNRPPVASVGGAQAGIAHNATVTLSGSATDPDADETFTYQWVQIDDSNNPLTPTASDRDLAVTLTDATTTSPTFTAPYLPSTTTLRFRLTVTDLEGATNSAVATVEVLANRAPVVNPGADQTNQAANSTVTLTGSATDADLDTITYEWVQVDGSGNPITPTASVTDEAVELATSTAASTTFVAPIINASTTLRFRLTATDSEGAATSAVTTVQVNANRAPSATYANAWVSKTNVVAVATTNVSLANRACSDVNIGGVNNIGNGQRVLLTAQDDPTRNGIYTVPNRPGTNFIGGCAGSNAWVRATDADTAAELAYLRVGVSSGTGAGTSWVLPTAAAGITVGTTPIGIVQLTNNELPLTVSPAAGARVKGATVTVSFGQTFASNADPDNTSSDLFTYRIARVASASATTPCEDACGGLAATITPVDGSGGRQATFTVPGVTSADPMYFRLFVDDGFGASYVSPVATVTFTNTPAAISSSSRQLIKVYAGADVRIDANGVITGGTPDPRTIVGGPGVSPLTTNNTPNDGRPGSAGNYFPKSSYVYGGIPLLLDARDLAAAADADGGATVDFQTGLPPVATGIDLSGGLNVVTGNPSGVCNAGFVLNRTSTPNVWSFTPPTGVSENFGFCRIQFRVNDSFPGGGSTTWGVPVGCLDSGTQGLVGLGELLGLIPSGSLPACTSPAVGFHAGDRNQQSNARVNNVSSNVNSDFWIQIFQNKAVPFVGAEELPTRTFSSVPGQAATTVALDGSDTIDADGTDGRTPLQPLLYRWTALDPNTLEELPDDNIANQLIANRDAVVTTFALPDSGPSFFRFRLDVFDGLTRDIVDTNRMKVTVRRPTAAGTATKPIVTSTTRPTATPASTPAPTYSTAIPNDSLGDVKPDDRVALSAAGSSSPDGRTLRYQWRVLRGPASAQIENARSLNATLVVGNPDNNAASQELVVELTVRDGFSSAYKTFTFNNLKKAEEPPPVIYCPLPASLTPYPYTDVPANATFRTDVACLVEKRVLIPGADKLFNPNGTFTRGALIQVLHRLAGTPTGFPRASVTDVPNSGGLRDAVNWAVATGVTVPQGGLFKPADVTTRSQLMVFLYRQLGSPAPAAANPPVFTDIASLSLEQRNAITWMAQRGVITSGGTYRPTAGTIRSFMATSVFRYGQLKPGLWNINPTVWAPRP